MNNPKRIGESKMVRFSILVPVYNGEKYLRECIESILTQTYKNFELIIVDDGSTDSTPIICEEYAEKDKRIRVFHQENKGRYMARMACINHASGEFVFFIDADDYILLDCLEKINAQIEKTSSDLVIFDHTKVTMQKEYEYMDTFYEYKQELIFDEQNKREIYLKFLSSHKLNSLCFKVFRNDLLDINLLNAEYDAFQMGEDAVISAQTYKNAERISYFKYAPYYYRLNFDGIVNTFSFSKFYGLEKMLDEKHKFRIDVNMNDKKTMTDMAEYNFKIIKDMVEILSFSEISFKEKKQHLNRIKEKPFYKDYVSYLNLKSVSLQLKLFYTLLKRKYYRIALLLLKVNRCLN